MSGNNILILGATGMLGHTLFYEYARRGYSVQATVRSAENIEKYFPSDVAKSIVSGIDAGNFETVRRLLHSAGPDIVINCIGIVKQLPEAGDPVASISINALFPHKLAAACREIGSRMIHISTDCVFSGEKGMYTENDRPDADDLYGRSKLLGEVDYPNAVTLRTSIIGHEIGSRHGLVEWFLSQEGRVNGYTKAVFSGFPTIEMARIIADHVIPDSGLTGLYHVSSPPISKYDLLREVAERYGKRIEIEKSDDLRCDRSLDSGRFRKATGYRPPAWPELVERMHKHFTEAPHYKQIIERR